MNSIDVIIIIAVVGVADTVIIIIRYFLTAEQILFLIFETNYENR